MALLSIQFRSAILVALAGFVVPSRSASGQTDRSTDRGQPDFLLHGERITEPGLLSFPVQILVVGEIIIVLDNNSDTLGVVLDRSTGRLLARFGPSGRAAGDFIAPVAVDVDPSSDRSFWVIDGQLQRATRLSVVFRSKAGIRIRTDSTVPFPVKDTTPIVTGFVDRTGAFILAGFFDRARFARVSSGASRWVAFGPQPPGDEDVPLRVRQQAYQTCFAPDPSRVKFAAATRYSDRLEVFRMDGSRLASAKRIRGFEAVYGVRRTARGLAMLAGTDLRYAYLSVTADSQSIYALFSGRTQSEAPGRAWFGSVVEQYDWNAVRRRVYGLDEDAVAIATEEGGQVLYAVVHGRVPAVVRYELPP